MTSTSDRPDPRIHPYRPDLAASYLRGRVEADRFIDGVPCQVRTGFANVMEQPGFDQRQSTQLLFGEVFTVFDDRDGWVWGQNGTDGYVGWMRLENLTDEVGAPTHRLTALRSFLFAEPDLKTPFIDVFSMGAPLMVVEEKGAWVQVDGGGWLYGRHVAPLDAPPADPVETALKFLGAPYLWGGRTSIGLDCSGLVQIACMMAGIDCPRDSDQQKAALGTQVSADGRGHAYHRGDIVFFPGHVGIMADATTLIHANAHHMAVVREPLADVLARAGDKGGITAVKRLG